MHFGGIDGGGVGAFGRLQRPDPCAELFEHLLGDGVGFSQLLGTFQFRVGVFQGRVVSHEIRLGLLQRSEVRLRIDLKEDLARLHVLALEFLAFLRLAGANRDDLPAHARLDRHGLFGLDSADRLQLHGDSLLLYDGHQHWHGRHLGRRGVVLGATCCENCQEGLQLRKKRLS